MYNRMYRWGGGEWVYDRMYRCGEMVVCMTGCTGRGEMGV